MMNNMLYVFIFSHNVKQYLINIANTNMKQSSVNKATTLVPEDSSWDHPRVFSSFGKLPSAQV